MALSKTAKKEHNRHVKNAEQIMKRHADDPELVRDVLADLMHYCKAKGYFFDGELSSARGHFEAEQRGE
jgi:CCR4-NOT transcriptional regulation complex NOT5 subunit